MEIDITFFKVESTGVVSAVRDCLNLIKSKALCIKGFIPVAVSETPPSVAEMQIKKMKWGEKIFPFSEAVY